MIGFLETNYFANESSGLATVEFGLISGGVQSNVNVQLGFNEGTARGIFLAFMSALPIIIKFVWYRCSRL